MKGYSAVRALAVGLLALASFASFVGCAEQPTQDISGLQAQVDASEAAFEAQSEEIAAIKAEVAQLTTTVAGLEDALGRIAGQIEALSADAMDQSDAAAPSGPGAPPSSDQVRGADPAPTSPESADADAQGDEPIDRFPSVTAEWDEVLGGSPAVVASTFGDRYTETTSRDAMFGYQLRTWTYGNALTVIFYDDVASFINYATPSIDLGLDIIVGDPAQRVLDRAAARWEVVQGRHSPDPLFNWFQLSDDPAKPMVIVHLDQEGNRFPSRREVSDATIRRIELTYLTLFD